MKKLILLFTGILFSGFIFAQTLALSDDQGVPIANGETVYAIAEPSMGSQIPIVIHVTNNGSTAAEVKVCRTEDQVLPDVSDEFCWAGACFPPGSDTSFLSTSIDPGVTNTSFEAKYTHNDHFGESTYTYTFFDVDDPANKVSVVVVFKLSGVGIDEIAENTQVSEAYPNPANAYAFFDYSIPENTPNATFVVTNLLGAVVEEIPLNGNSGKIRINTSDLDNGLYFASLKVGNIIASTQRLVVNH